MKIQREDIYVSFLFFTGNTKMVAFQTPLSQSLLTFNLMLCHKQTCAYWWKGMAEFCSRYKSHFPKQSARFSTSELDVLMQMTFPSHARIGLTGLESEVTGDKPKIFNTNSHNMSIKGLWTSAAHTVWYWLYSARETRAADRGVKGFAH